MDQGQLPQGDVMARGVAAPWLDRDDRPVPRPPHLIAFADEVPPPAILLPTMLQQVGTQAVYCILAVVVAGVFGLSDAEAIGFLGVTLLSLSLGGMMQAAMRGPIGSGYGLSLIPMTSMLAPYCSSRRRAGASRRPPSSVSRQASSRRRWYQGTGAC